jgi:hypothetical protein
VIERTNLNDAGVINQDVDPAEPIDDFPDGGLNLITVEQIAFDSENFSTAPGEIGFRAHEFFAIAGNESDLSALLADVSRQHEAEPARSTTDQGNSIPQRVLNRPYEPSGYPTAE